MRFFLLVAALVIMIVVPTTIYRLARRRLDRQIAQVARWQNLPTAAERERSMWEALREEMRADAMRWQIGASISIAGLTFAAVSLWLIYDIADDTNTNADQVAELAADNCRLYVQFITDEAGDSSREIDVLTSEIIAIQDAIDSTPTHVQDVPGYSEAPEWFRVFLSGLLEDQVVQAQAQIVELRERRSALEQREKDLEDLLETADCPRAG